MILLHGGGWFTGDKTDYDLLNIYDTLVRQGYAVVTMNYRLAPQNKYPAPIDDIDSGIAYLVRNKLKFKIDPEKICMMGRSSGGHLALQYAYTRNKNGYVKAVIDCFGIPDLTDRTNFAIRLDTQIANLMGGPYLANEYIWHDASPMYHVSTAVPTAIFQGDKDDTVYPAQSENLKDSLQQHGIPFDYIIWKGYGHFFDIPTWQATMVISTNWLQNYMF